MKIEKIMFNDNCCLVIFRVIKIRLRPNLVAYSNNYGIKIK